MTSLSTIEVNFQNFKDDWDDFGINDDIRTPMGPFSWEPMEQSGTKCSKQMVGPELLLPHLKKKVW